MADQAPTDLYDAQRKYLDRALQSRKGLRLRFEDLRTAQAFRIRCYNLKKLDRKNNNKIYPTTDPMHNASAYDGLVISLESRDGIVQILIHNNQPEPIDVTEL